jgi:hypothetical protein
MRLLMEDSHMAVSHVKAGIAVSAIGEMSYEYRDCMEQDDKTVESWSTVRASNLLGVE